MAIPGRLGNAVFQLNTFKVLSKWGKWILEAMSKFLPQLVLKERYRGNILAFIQDPIKQYSVIKTLTCARTEDAKVKMTQFLFSRKLYGLMKKTFLFMITRWRYAEISLRTIRISFLLRQG